MDKHFKLGLLFILITGTANAATYHVASSGGDFSTMAELNAAAFAPGDSILFNRGEVFSMADGTYLNFITTGKKGTALNHITIGAYGSGDLPIIDGGNVATRGMRFDHGSGAFYIDISNLEIRNINGYGIQVGDGKSNIPFYVDISNVKIHDCDSTGNPVGVWIYSQNNSVVDSEIYNIGGDAIFYSGSGNEFIRLYLHNYDTKHSVGDGIQGNVDSPNSYSVITDSTIIDPWKDTKGCVIIQNDGTGTTATISGNYCSGGTFGIFSTLPNTIVSDNYIYDSGDAINAYSQDGRYINNVIVDANNAFYARADVTGMKFYGNTVYGAKNRCLDAYTTYHTGLSFKNNICHLVDGANSYFSISDTVDFDTDHNIFYSPGSVATPFQTIGGPSFTEWKTETGQDAHSITSEPQLKVDYSLYPTSPAINAGTYLTEVPTDYYGNPRIGNDIGAITFGRTNYKGLTISGATTVK